MAAEPERDLEGEEGETDARADAERGLRRRAALAQIRQYPDPALRLRANEVTEFDAALARLADRMAALMDDAQGVGLAATQVGVLQRLFVFRTDGDGEAHAVVNPELVRRSSETEVAEEGCLSLQGVHVPVERSVSVALEGRGLEGEPFRLDLEDMAARVVQHELDHLDGVLIVERTDPESRRDALAILRRGVSGP